MSLQLINDCGQQFCVSLIAGFWWYLAWARCLAGSRKCVTAHSSIKISSPTTVHYQITSAGKRGKLAVFYRYPSYLLTISFILNDQLMSRTPRSFMRFYFRDWLKLLIISNNGEMIFTKGSISVIFTCFPDRGFVYLYTFTAELQVCSTTST